jgi:long-chain fatty acid transport protein
MKRLNFLLVFMLISSQVLMAGGLKTNVNQSAAWARTLSRDATLDIDGVYFNPAGLAHLSNGLHLSLSNMSIWQTRTITSDYMYLSGAPVDYEAELMAPIFPNLYVAYKTNKWTFSGGFGIVGGGGSADFPDGLPTFEIPIASLVPQLGASLAPIDAGFVSAGFPDPGFREITGYNVNTSFLGSSNYFGYQAGATYAINDMLSVYLGGRLVTASNSYEGSLAGVTIDAPAAYGGTMPAGNYLRIVAQTPGLDPTVVAQLEGTADVLDVATADAELDAGQTGMGFTPIIGVNIHISDMLNIGARYEHHTKMELTNETSVDDVGMFPDGVKVRADLPGMFSLGAQVRPLKNLSASVGFNYFLDKSASYGNDETGDPLDNESIIDENGYTYSAALEYKLLGILGVSVGYTSGNNGVNPAYQSNMTYALKSQTFGGGVFVDLGEMIRINAGFNMTTYDDYDMAETYALAPTVMVPYTDTYAKKTTIFAIGVDIHL